MGRSSPSTTTAQSREDRRRARDRSVRRDGVVAVLLVASLWAAWLVREVPDPARPPALELTAGSTRCTTRSGPASWCSARTRRRSTPGILGARFPSAAPAGPLGADRQLGRRVLRAVVGRGRAFAAPGRCPGASRARRPSTRCPRAPAPTAASVDRRRRPRRALGLGGRGARPGAPAPVVPALDDRGRRAAALGARADQHRADHRGPAVGDPTVTRHEWPGPGAPPVSSRAPSPRAPA